MDDETFTDFNQYLEECRTAAQLQWCYSELPDDHVERAQQAFELGEEPADFIRWLGEKYDLTPYGGGIGQW